MKYLLDTNICIYFFRGKYDINELMPWELIGDFDLLIGSTAIANDLIMVTQNIKEFERLVGIKLENWVEA